MGFEFTPRHTNSPDRGSGAGSEQYAPPTFKKTGDVQMRWNETSEQLHERLWPIVENSFLTITNDTGIKITVVTEANYVVDVASILKIPNAVAVFTSNCKHETPYKIIVGVRDGPTLRRPSDGNVVTSMRQLGFDLSSEQKRAIYDYAPF